MGGDGGNRLGALWGSVWVDWGDDRGDTEVCLVGGCFGALCKGHYGYCPKMKKIGVHDSLSDNLGILILVNSFHDKISVWNCFIKFNQSV